ncbi:MAG: cation transporter, partial [Chroococcales cyanobacterium]
MHQHSTSCSHCHSSVTPSKSKIRLLVTALVLIITFAGTEFAVGMFSHSLALVADSEHLVSDCLALGLALFATWMA